MRDELAEHLLVRVMRWESEDVSRERPDLQALAHYKYNDYQQFSPGMRFIESLALWLEQFATDEERKIAYAFVKNQLIFVSRSEFAHLASISYPDLVRPYLVKTVAPKIGKSPWLVKTITTSREFKLLLRQSLFLALSDGSRIDMFRRSNPVIDHEQVFRAHEIAQDRADEMLEKLNDGMTHILGTPPSKDKVKFRIVFLLDDFSASGISYIRNEEGNFHGKVAKFHDSLSSPHSGIPSLVDTSDLTVCLLLYVATEHAAKRLQEEGTKLFGNIPFTVLVAQLIPDGIGESLRNNPALTKLCAKYYDSNIETDSYKRGRHDQPYLGFDECCLPVVLDHNTPNNSIPLLWFPDAMSARGLFPRVSRFSE
jgi:hypothetical protein